MREELPAEVRVAPGQTAGEAIGSLQLQLVDAVVIAVNGRVVDWNYLLQPGDRLELIPAIGGGSLK